LDLLAEALRATSEDETIRLAREFLTHRHGRRSTHGLNTILVEYEGQREWVGGLAKYTELEIWRQAATAPYFEPSSTIAGDPDFEGYATFEKRWEQELAQLTRIAGDRGDGRLYYTGWAQAVLLDRLASGWRERIMEEAVFLDDLLNMAVSAE
jgi:hypothetical protein